MPAATLTPIAESPLDQAHHLELAAAAERAQPIRRAARVASFNAWTTAVLAGLSAPFALFSVIGFLAFIALAAVAWNEFRGRRRLLAFDPAGATIIGWNQLGLLAMIAAYCVWAVYSNLYGANSVEAQLKANPEYSALFGSLDELGDVIEPLVVGFYAVVVALSAVFQGANALYYFTRRKLIEAYIRETPVWVLDLQRATRAA